jgi:hypothetical protein
MKNRWLRRGVNALLFIGLTVASLVMLAMWVGQRDVPSPTAAEREQAFKRAVSWVRTHEAEILQERNIALWWFVQAAAERSADPDLAALMARHRALSARDGITRLPWWHMLAPKADTPDTSVQAESLEPYQRFLYHAVTCQPVALGQGDTTAYLSADACRPMVSQVFVRDPVCTTHQLMGVLQLSRMACTTAPKLPLLERELLADIEQQMQWDVVLKDAYFQRVMMLMWRGHPEQLKPVWLHRVYQAQQPDGGWAGGRQFPELPPWAQPWMLRAKLATWWPSRFHAGTSFDFHASAQGLLITALALPERKP